jgi:uncharacterized protein YjcR
MKQTRASLYIEDRNAGMKYKEIAEKYGVSYQAVSQVCAKRKGVCVYCKWINC